MSSKSEELSQARWLLTLSILARSVDSWASGNSIPRVDQPVIHINCVRVGAGFVCAVSASGWEFSVVGLLLVEVAWVDMAGVLDRVWVLSGSSPCSADPLDRSMRVVGLAPCFIGYGWSWVLDPAGGEGDGAGCDARGWLGSGATGVGPGITHSLGLHSAIPSGDPVKMTLLSHCENEFQASHS